jgi:hypothetical protein
MLLTAAWGLGILLALYGGASWVQHGLMEVGVLIFPAGLGSTWTWWHFSYGTRGGCSAAFCLLWWLALPTSIVIGVVQLRQRDMALDSDGVWGS